MYSCHLSWTEQPLAPGNFDKAWKVLPCSATLYPLHLRLVEADCLLKGSDFHLVTHLHLAKTRQLLLSFMMLEPSHLLLAYLLPHLLLLEMFQYLPALLVRGFINQQWWMVGQSGTYKSVNGGVGTSKVFIHHGLNSPWLLETLTRPGMILPC